MMADVYSAGIVLFVMKTRGTLPHLERDSYKGINFYQLMYDDNETFWRKHVEV